MLGTPKPLCIIYYELSITTYILRLTNYPLPLTAYPLTLNPALGAFPKVFFIYVLRTERYFRMTKYIDPKLSQEILETYQGYSLQVFTLSSPLNSSIDFWFL